MLWEKRFTSLVIKQSNDLELEMQKNEKHLIPVVYGEGGRSGMGKGYTKTSNIYVIFYLNKTSKIWKYVKI